MAALRARSSSKITRVSRGVSRQMPSVPCLLRSKTIFAVWRLMRVGPNHKKKALRKRSTAWLGCPARSATRTPSILAVVFIEHWPIAARSPAASSRIGCHTATVTASCMSTVEKPTSRLSHLTNSSSLITYSATMTPKMPIFRVKSADGVFKNLTVKSHMIAAAAVAAAAAD